MESNNMLNWIREEIARSLKEISTEFGAYRRVVIISPKMKEIKANIKELLSRKEVKSQYKSCKVTMKDGVKPNMLVVDFNGEGATGLAAKAVDLAKKHDNNAEIKVRKERPLSESAATMKHLISTMPYRIRDEGMFKAAYFGKSAIRYRVKKYPDVNDGYPVYEMHLDLHPSDQGKGLAADMIKVFLYKEGGVAWFSHGRITNPNAYKVLDKIKRDPDWKVEDIGDGITVEEA